ncbi:hypothetical protein [Marinobacter sp.]|jgi:hypothetical protein|uniref:hypothetical protein n=1 Tax=Marinobacter sp. TaxID=50741 RepID=UPI002353AE96|nr:hypothetical protein [Marinobacter sp.]|tara:strand:+ start:656 stop:1135 length:480 start_codon:yes stop_codon:yes gene_type:complete
MVEKRNVRANEIRDSIRQQKPAVSWKPPSLLDAPECRPGYVQRWITTSIQGKETPDNVYKRMREGWNPRSADSVKDKRYPTINHGEWKGCIGIEGMLLCEMPEETHRSMKAYYNQRNSEQNEAVATDLDALGRKTGQPIYQTRESTSSRGRDLSIMDDK